MKPLLEFADRHPAATTLATIGSGALAWVFDHSQEITNFASLIGSVCAALVALVGLLAKVWTWTQRLLTAVRRWHRNREQRRLHAADAPLESRPLRKIRLEDNADETFTLLEPIEWIDLSTATCIIVAAGETTDFASIPRIFWGIIPPYGRHGYAAVIHDHLYGRRGRIGDHQLTRADCDRIFREIMAASGVRWSRRWIMWLGVRLGGWLPWYFGPDDD